MEPFADDDFGELYADIELPNAISDFTRLYVDPQPEQQQHQQENKQEETDAANDEVAKVDAEGLVSDAKNDEDQTNDDNDCVGSDSDDDLNIVLNDEDCADFPAKVVGCDEEEVGGGDEGVDHLPEASELVSKNGVKGGYGSRFFHHKYMRTRGSMFVNNMKVNKTPMAMASSLNNSFQNLTSSSYHATRMCAAANPMGIQRGYGSFLPWYWSIFDVNMETLTEKPWMVPGADVTDYFNFGFNENTWKLYCASLEQLWRTSEQTGIPVDEAVKLSQVDVREQIDHVVSGGVHSPSSASELPKGRAIQVEECMVERQPSAGVRRPRSRDSDVIIQIKVLDSSEDCSGSGNSIVMDASYEGESIVGHKRNILNSSGEHDDVLCEDQLNDVKKSEDSSVQERNGLVPGVEEDVHQNQADEHSEDTAEVQRKEVKAKEGTALVTCSADPYCIESELSLGDQELSLTSYTDSDSEATENSVHAEKELSHSPLRRQSVNSVTNLMESSPKYCKNLKNNFFNRKPVNAAYYSRNRGPFRKEWRHQSGRHEHGSNLKKHIENDSNVSSMLRSNERDLSLLDNKFLDCDSHKERLQDHTSCKRRDISHNRETKSRYYGGKVVDDLFQRVHTKDSCWEDQESFREKNTNRHDRKNGDERDYFFYSRFPMEHSEDRDISHNRETKSRHYGGKVVDDLFQRVHTKYSYWEDQERFKENKNQHDRKNGDDGDYFFDPRSPMEDSEDRETNWYHADWGYSPDDSSPHSYWESRQFSPKHTSFTDKEWDTQRRRVNDNSLFRDRCPNSDFDECDFEFLNKSYGMSTFVEREMESLDNEQEERFQRIGGDWNRYARRHRHHDGSPLVFDNSWPGKIEDKYQKDTHHQTLNFRYRARSYTDSMRSNARGSRVNEKFRGCVRPKHVRDNRGRDWSKSYIDAAEEDFMIHHVEEYQFYRSPSDVLDWTEDEIIWRHHETHATSGHARVHLDDKKMHQHQLNVQRRGGENCLKGSFKIMGRGKHGQTVLRCRKPVALINGEGKSHAKSARVLCNDRLEYPDQGIVKKRKALAGFDESLKKGMKFNTPKYKGNQENKKQFQNLPDKGKKENSDIEEGQIVTEEPYLEASVSRRDVPEGAAVADCVKKTMSQNENNSDQFIGGYDNQKILDSLAKMEKRRERFKQPLTTRKEAEDSLKLNNDSVIDAGEMKQHFKQPLTTRKEAEDSLKLNNDSVIVAGEMKQHRPARKRRWVGS